MDGYPVFAENIEDEKLLTSGYDEGWVYRHCRISQYMLQIVKCEDPDCCSQMRTVWKSVIPSGFLPAPAPINIEKGVSVPVKQNTKKTDKYPNHWKRLAITDLVPYTGFIHMPYDWHCPSIKNINKRICKECDVYFPSMAAVTRHRRGKGCTIFPDETNDDESVEEMLSGGEDEMEISGDETTTAPILNIFEMLAQNPFMDADNDDGEKVE